MRNYFFIIMCSVPLFYDPRRSCTVASSGLLICAAGGHNEASHRGFRPRPHHYHLDLPSNLPVRVVSSRAALARPPRRRWAQTPEVGWSKCHVTNMSIGLRSPHFNEEAEETYFDQVPTYYISPHTLACTLQCSATLLGTVQSQFSRCCTVF